MVFGEKIKVRCSKLIIGGYNLNNFNPHMTISIVDREKHNNFKYWTHRRVTLQLGSHFIVYRCCVFFLTPPKPRLGALGLAISLTPKKTLLRVPVSYLLKF